MTKHRIARISLVGIVIFGLLLGGQVIYKKNWINSQIAKDTRQINGVVSAQVVTENGQSIFEVKTNHLTHLMSASQRLQTIAGNRPIRYIDQRTPELEKVLSQMEFSIQEGVARGNFTQMEQSLQQQAKSAGVHLELAMDNQAIYLTLDQGQAQLVEVVERHGQVNYLPSVGQGEEEK